MQASARSSDDTILTESHTIVLLQAGVEPWTRTYSDYDSVSRAMDGVCALFEKQLRSSDPSLRNISYEISALYTYIDSLPDITALVFEPRLKAYIPHDRQWIKQQSFLHLKSLAAPHHGKSVKRSSG